MSGRRHVGLVAAAATLLAALPLTTIFQQWSWLVQSVIAVLFVAGAATLARSLRAPAWVQLISMMAALLVVLTFLAPDSRAFAGLIPTPETFARFSELLTQAGTAMRQMGVPVGDHDGLLFLTVLGVGSVAIAVDLCAVTLRRPALAGLPMLAIYSVPVAVHQGSVSIIPFMAGAAGFLWLLVIDNVDKVRRFGRRFTGDGRDIDVWEPSPLAAAGRRMGIIGVVVAVALPVLVPGMTTGLLDRFGSGGQGDGTGTGQGNGRQVNLWAMLEGTLKQDEETEMVRLTTEDKTPGYLRFGVSDELSIDGFRNRNPTGRTSVTELPDPRRGRSAGIEYYEGKASVDIANMDMRLLPVYSEPTAVTRGIDAKWFYDQRSQLIYSTSASTSGRKYDFEYVRASYSPAALRQAPTLPGNSEIRQQLTAVPAGVEPVETQVAALIKDRTNDYDKVRALYDFFSAKNDFVYSLDARSETGGPAIVEFLDRRSGYCVQYAAALAWMVRVAGIPARVAFGFTKGTLGEKNTYSLTNRNLHAWTEVYFEGFGWVPFDATPSSFLTGAVDPVWAPNPDAAPDNTPTTGPSAGPGGSPGPGDDDQSGDNTPPGEGVDTGGGAAGNQTSPIPMYLSIAGLALLVLLVLPGLRRAALRMRRRPTRAAAGELVVAAEGVPRVVVEDGPPAARARHDAHAAWDELMDTLVDFQLLVDQAETPRGTAERVIRDSVLREDAASGARLLGQAEERARYARAPMVTGELTTAMRAIRRALAIRAPRRIRWSAVLLPRSVLLRWRLAVVNGVTTVVATTGRWRDSTARAISPRRLLPNRR